MRRGVSCNENRFFPVRITTQGKPCSGHVLALHCSICAVYENRNDPSEISLLHYTVNSRHCAENTVTTKLSYFVGKLYVHIQGLPYGFDIIYLALVNGNMQVIFDLKVVWDS